MVERVDEMSQTETMKKDEIITKLIKEYLSKCKEYGCDSCIAQIYCIENNLRESRYPQDYCEENLLQYLVTS